jgi:multidrug efflux pump subunit AcrA (membrane-fusion protein)
VTLPSTLQPAQATDLLPRVDGFVRAWKAEIGARVRAGQVLAEIDAPELDQEVLRAEAQAKQGEADLEQARAELDEAKAELTLAESNLERARANLDFASTQAHRNRRLLGTRSVSREDYDRTVSDMDARTAELRAGEADVKRRQTNLGTRAATIRSREATLATARANVRRLHELQGFKRILAPFDGGVSRREAEVGMRVSASAGRPLYRVVQTDTLRVQLSVPQAFAALVRASDPASIKVPEQPGRAFPGRVARVAGEIETGSRTVLVELELPNPNGELLPGTYAQVTITGRRADGALLVPGSAVMMRPQGPHIAVVNSGTIRLAKVELGRDRGGQVEVLAGLTARDQIATNPSDDLVDGSRVEPQAAHRP